jgi:hypothetical protein
MANWVRPRPSSYRGQAVRSTISKTWSPPPFKGRSCVSGFAVPTTPPKGRMAGEPRGSQAIYSQKLKIFLVFFEGFDNI